MMSAAPGLADEVAPSADLCEVLDRLEVHLRRFVFFGSEHDAVAVALYCAGTHVFERAETFPLLAFMSPVRRSGKTRAMDVLESIVHRPWRVIRPSEPVLFRKLDRDMPTLMLDEIDAIWSEGREHEGIRSILNAGNRKGTTVARAVPRGKSFDLVDFEIYGPKILAGIGDLPDTVRDRTIVINMARKAPGDQVERLRARDARRLGRPFGEALSRLTLGEGDLVLDSARLPSELDDRAQDGWEPLFVIADMAGGAWPDRARAAAIALSSERDDVDNDSIEIVLLRDIRSVFGEDTGLLSGGLIQRLLDLELGPWREVSGKPLSAKMLAGMLRPFGIKPHRDRAGSMYAVADFRDAWARYLPSEPATTATMSTSPVADMTVVAGPRPWLDLEESWEFSVPDDADSVDLLAREPGHATMGR